MLLVLVSCDLSWPKTAKVSSSGLATIRPESEHHVRDLSPTRPWDAGGLWVLQRCLCAQLGQHLMILLLHCRTTKPVENKQRPIPWQQLERSVRTVAEAKFGATARAEDIAGVKCDCVIHLTDGSVVIIEISKEKTLDKLRQDVSKFNTIRPFFIQQNIFPRCFFVTLGAPTPALIAAGQANHVEVYSFSQFFNLT